MAVRPHAASREYGPRQQRIRALDGVDIGLPAGSWTAVRGPSGSGKSTLLHCAAGLERVTEGQILLGGKEITTLSDAELTVLRRGAAGFVFQCFNPIGSLTAEQNVSLPVKLSGLRVSKSEARETSRSVGLGDRLARLEES